MSFPQVLRDVGRLLVLEARLYAALLRWCLRRKDVPAAAEPWPYAALAAPVMWLWIFGSATEVVVFHLIIPWDPVRIVVDVISIWGLIWMMGTLAAFRIRPHLLLPDELRVRNSVYHDVSIPMTAIASAAAREVELPSSMRSLQITAEDGASQVSVGVSGRTNVVLTLRSATPLQTAKGTVTADTVRLWVDDPRLFVTHMDRRLTPAPTVPTYGSPDGRSTAPALTEAGAGSSETFVGPDLGLPSGPRGGPPTKVRCTPLTCMFIRWPERRIDPLPTGSKIIAPAVAARGDPAAAVTPWRRAAERACRCR